MVAPPIVMVLPVPEQLVPAGIPVQVHVNVPPPQLFAVRTVAGVWPTVQGPRVVGVIEQEAPELIVTMKDLELVIELASVTNAVKLNGLPVVVVGVPLNTPTLDRLVPVGTVPLDTLQVKGVVPPLATTV